jgi:hypothetical protein
LTPDFFASSLKEMSIELRSVINSPAAFKSLAAVTLCCGSALCAGKLDWARMRYPGGVARQS